MKHMTDPTFKGKFSFWPLIAAFIFVAMLLVLMTPAKAAQHPQEAPILIAKAKKATKKVTKKAKKKAAKKAKAAKQLKAKKAAKKGLPANGNLLEVTADGKYIFHASKEKVAAVLVKRIALLQDEVKYQKRKGDDFQAQYFGCVSARTSKTRK